MQVSGEYRDGGYQEYTSHVKCESCGSISEVVTESLSLSEVEKMAEEAWNTRAERTCEIELDKGVPDFIKDSLDTYFCANCGSPIYNDMKPTYCIYCGAKVVE